MTFNPLSKLLKILTAGLLLTACLKTFAGFNHPYHVSVTEIVQNVSTGTLEITIKTIPEDMFQILEERYKGALFIGENCEKPESDSVLADYLSETFILMVNGQSVAPIFIGKELELDAFWCYLEVSEQTKINSLELTNTMLLENNFTQTNIIHFIVGKDQKTAYLNRETVNCVFKF
jgi:hypothetical protein